MIRPFSAWSPTSIRHKLTLAAIACILVPAVFTLILYNFMTQEAVKRQAITNAESSLHLVGESVTNLLTGMLDVTNYIQVNSGLGTYLKLVASGKESADPYTAFTEKNRVLEQLDSLTYLGSKKYVTVILTNDEYYMNYSVSDFNPLEFKREPWFGRLERFTGMQSLWTGPQPTVFQYDKFDHPYQISVARTLRLESSKIYGYAVVTIMESQIRDVFGSLSEENGIMLLDAEGRIVSARDPGVIGTVFPQQSLVEGLKETSVVGIGGERYLVAQQRMAFNGWRLVLMEPYKEATVNISSIFSRVFVFQLISFAVFLILLLVLVRRFTRPLVRLGKVTSAVQRGNLEVRSGVRGNDEIGRLGLLFDQMLDRVGEMIWEVSDNQMRKRKAELKMLQAQINPHFLFNVLNSIRMKVMKRGDPDSAKMIGSLSMLLRMTISREEDAITLHEEIDLLRHYVSLMNLRQKEEVTLLTRVDPEAFLVRVPRFILQPLVENALIHGLGQLAGTITVGAGFQGGQLILTVEDNGRGMGEDERLRILGRIQGGTAGAGKPGSRTMSQDTAQEAPFGRNQGHGTGQENLSGVNHGRAAGPAGGRQDRGMGQGDSSAGSQVRAAGQVEVSGRSGGFSGIGLVNVAERMQMLYGGGFRIDVISGPGKGTAIRMEIPVERGDADV